MSGSGVAKRAWGLVAVLLVAGCGAAVATPAASKTPTPSPSPTMLHVSGVLTLISTSFELAQPGTGCSGSDGYSDIQTGAQVVVTSETGAVLATGELGLGTVPEAGSCTFGIVVDAVPPGHSFYGVSVTHRGIVQFQPTQLTNVQLTLGNP